MLHARTFLFALIMSLAAQSKMHASQISKKQDQLNNELLRITAMTCAEDDVKCAEIALLKGANVNARDGSGETILIKATQKNRRHLVKFLLETQPTIDINLSDNLKKTALSHAIKKVYNTAQFANHDIIPAPFYATQDILKMLVQHGGEFDIDANTSDADIDQIHPMFEGAFQDASGICEQREKARAAYEHEVTNQLDPYIPVKDLNNIINEYAKMNIVQFVHMQKQAELQAAQK